MPQRDGPRLNQRNADIWNRYLAGWTQQRIAAEYDLSQQHVSDILRDVRESIPERQRDELITTSAERLDLVLSEAFDVLGRTHYVTSGGKTVHDITRYATDEDGNVLLDRDGHPKAADLDKLVDDGPRLQAIDRIVKIDAEYRKLFGLDAAQKVDASVHQTTPADAALQQLIADAKAAAEATEQGIRDGRA